LLVRSARGSYGAALPEGERSTGAGLAPRWRRLTSGAAAKGRRAGEGEAPRRWVSSARMALGAASEGEAGGERIARRAASRVASPDVTFCAARFCLLSLLHGAASRVRLCAQAYAAAAAPHLLCASVSL